MKVLLFNVGSSSLKFSVMESTDLSVTACGMTDWAGEETLYQFSAPNADVTETVEWDGPSNAVNRTLQDLSEALPGLFSGPNSLIAIGHRVVHGGEFVQATRITSSVRAQLTDLSRLAPLHNPPSIEAIDAATAQLRDIPHIACFDTAFHRTMIPSAQEYAIPQEWAVPWKIRRYGFHGLSHAYCAGRAAEMLPVQDLPLKLVICHLGHGCSASAVRGGKCIDTTMGFTPLEGLMMATRSGSLDPELVLYLQREHGLTPDEISHGLNRHSGLLGVSGISSDMRIVLESARHGNERAMLAVAMYCHRVRQAIGALAATLGGVDVLVFTAGVGENSSEIRNEICNGLECLNLHLDSVQNLECEPDEDVAETKSLGRILVIKTREDLTMLQQTMRVVERLGDICETNWKR
jgi:acetate kinase